MSDKTQSSGGFWSSVTHGIGFAVGSGLVGLVAWTFTSRVRRREIRSEIRALLEE